MNDQHTPTKRAALTCDQLIESAHDSFTNQKYQMALASASDAKALSAQCTEADIIRARCFQKLGDLNSATQAAREALRHDPNSSQARSLLESIPSAQHESIDSPDQESAQLITSAQQHTMLGHARLVNLVTLVRTVAKNQIPGIFVECGVAGGGSLALIARAAQSNDLLDPRVYGFDTFTGMPEPTDADTAGNIPAQSTGWGQGTCAAPMEAVEQVLTDAGVSDTVTLVPGRFEDTLPLFAAELAKTNTKIAMLHADGDWYSSTHAILTHLCPHLSPSALIQIDDYGHWDGCRRATDAYLNAHAPGITLNPIDYTGRWIQWPS